MCDHLELALASGVPLDWERLGIRDEWTREIQEAMRVLSSSSGAVTLTAIKKAVREDIDFATIKFVRTRLQLDASALCEAPAAPVTFPALQSPTTGTLLLADRCEEDERAERERRERPPLLTHDQRKRKRQAVAAGLVEDSSADDNASGVGAGTDEGTSAGSNGRETSTASAPITTNAAPRRHVRARRDPVPPTATSVLEALGGRDEPLSRDRLQQILFSGENSSVASSLVTELERILDDLQAEGMVWMPSPSTFAVMH